MAKKTKPSQNKNAVVSPASTSTSSSKLVLRVKSNEGMRRSVRQTKSRETTRAKQKKNKQKIDAKKPKKPPTAFFYFLVDFRKEFQDQNPDVKSMRDIGKACGDKWKTMTYEENGDFEETDEESEYDE
ncbi:unnamed protein product [Trifolium pratense]|uniref:Uncharacterized protein n=1 Tax=Trifolium pratense TaxID=57577 RepID=A0ACB0MAN1_TRIPR|nr:unnamed protein product [Trifolium pratense]